MPGGGPKINYGRSKASRKVPSRAAQRASFSLPGLFLVPRVSSSLLPPRSLEHISRDVKSKGPVPANSHAWPLKMYVISRACNLSEKREGLCSLFG